MTHSFTIRPLTAADISVVTAWARAEGFVPGSGDLAIYRHTDAQGLWVGCLDGEPIGCIAGVRYDPSYGFIGLFLVRPDRRGRGFGLQLWRHALEHLSDVRCIGIEAAPDRIEDYAGWGFHPAAPTRRWRQRGDGRTTIAPSPPPWRLEPLEAVPEAVVQAYDARHEATPRPLFLGDWLHHPAGTVRVLLDGDSRCRGFGRIRPCLLPVGWGWRVGPLIADTPPLADALLAALLAAHPGEVLIDAPAANPHAAAVLAERGFTAVGETLRMYRGPAPRLPLDEIYGLACLELG
ncbi:GNAT family N-acetyltransferase [Cyanobium sp. FGCU-6]|jgi:ribosomal-protein-alanine N-acetyltransferase|nr:GNAT family N-acetyltransferase [Cyanobium sp. FGCU6]